MNFEVFVLMLAQKYPSLYDKNAVGYSDQSVRDTAYDTIIAEMKDKFYTIPAICTKEVINKFANDILSKDSTVVETAKMAFESSPSSLEIILENLMSVYENLWDKSNPRYDDLGLRNDSFAKIRDDLKKAHPFLAEFITTDFIDDSWKTKVRIIDAESFCSVR